MIKESRKHPLPAIYARRVPKGSVLSVTLFSVAINNILKEVTPPVKCSLFVSDLAIYCTGYNAASTCQYLQRSINSITKWADENGFKFSSVKSVAMRFTRSRCVEEIPTLTLKGHILPYEKNVNFLGLILDAKQTWSSHIDALKLKVKTSMNINPQVLDGVYKPSLVYCRMGFLNTLPFPALHLSRNAAIVSESLKISDQRMAKRY